VCWILLILLQWVAVHLEVVHLAWQLLLLPEICIFVFSVLSAYVFLYKKDPPFSFKAIFVGLLTIVAAIVPTRLNIDSFDLANCQGIVGPIWQVVYAFELLCLVSIAAIAIARFIGKDGKVNRLVNTLFCLGLIFFLSIFWASNLFGELTQSYEINLIGPVGMFLFLGMLSYMIIKFQIFNVKLFSSQVLVVALLLLIVALLFIQNIDYIHTVVLFTFGLVSILGANLIKSVKKEIEQRIKIERLAVELEKANEQLKELDKQKDELLGIVSHQLATPVSSLKWYLEMMNDGDIGKLSDEQNAHVKSMIGVAANLSDLVGMILDVSRIQLGRMHIEKQELDLEAFFREIVEVIDPKAKEKKVNLIVKIPTKLPKAMLDKRYTHMTIENLLSNAVKYTPEKGNVEFIVSLKGNMMTVTVKDTGVGIPKAEQDKIFGKMFRASNVRNTVDGNGFGLYVAKGAVEAQGGKISFASVEGKGTTFTVQLPLK